MWSKRCAFFFGEIDKPAAGILQRGKRKAVSVGICLDGVYVIDMKEKVSFRSNAVFVLLGSDGN